MLSAGAISILLLCILNRGVPRVRAMTGQEQLFQTLLLIFLIFPSALSCFVNIYELGDVQTMGSVSVGNWIHSLFLLTYSSIHSYLHTLTACNNPTPFPMLASIFSLTLAFLSSWNPEEQPLAYPAASAQGEAELLQLSGSEHRSVSWRKIPELRPKDDLLRLSVQIPLAVNAPWLSHGPDAAPPALPGPFVPSSEVEEASGPPTRTGPF